MSTLIITKNALMHLEQQIGDQAECMVNITDHGIDLIISRGSKKYIESLPFSVLFGSSMTSGQQLQKFEQNAVNYFAGINKD